jgi:hypothetical protein
MKYIIPGIMFLIIGVLLIYVGIHENDRYVAPTRQATVSKYRKVCIDGVTYADSDHGPLIILNRDSKIISCQEVK